MKIVKPSVELLWITENPEFQIERAGRTCYKSEDRITPDSARLFAGKMREHGHHAMIEHAVASFRIITDRGISHEIVRHRVASFAQESTRYCNYSDDKFGGDITVILPPGPSDEDGYRAWFGNWFASCRSAERNYFAMLKAGCSPQIARSVLPTCLKTELVMTANFREWLHFIALRGAKAAHPQIRPIAHEINRILAAHAPSIFKVEASE